MTSGGGDPPLVTDPDLDALTWQFLNSDYVADEYANWPLDRRLDGFLRNRGLGRLADNGDICNIILDRVMTYISVVPRPHGQRVGVGGLFTQRVARPTAVALYPERLKLPDAP